MALRLPGFFPGRTIPTSLFFHKTLAVKIDLLIMIIIVTLIAILKNIMSRMDNTAATLTRPEDKTQPAPGATDRRIDSKQLLGEEGRVIIEHDGQHYLLRQTHAGKLILTK